MSLPTFYQQFIAISRYARWIPEHGRRETWEETVDRYLNFMCDVQCPGKVDADTRSRLRSAILNCRVMPSMRAMMTAGDALKRDNMCGYNCTYTPIDEPRKFADILYILMCGTGVGFSCERQIIKNLPQVPAKMNKHHWDVEEGRASQRHVIVVEDSKVGWCEAFNEVINCLYSGILPEVDTSRIRPAGARLKTMGGRASGPAPLERLFQFVIGTFLKAKGRKLTSVEVHDIVCNIGEIVVVGGVRRCLPHGTRVLTVRDALLPIEAVTTDDLVMTPSGWRQVIAHKAVGKKKLLRIFHQDGYIDCTPEHRVAVLVSIEWDTWQIEWIEAQNIEPDMLLVTPEQTKKSWMISSGSSLPSWKYDDPAHSTTCTEIIIPKLDLEMAWFIGLFQGAGYTSGKEISVAIHRDELKMALLAKQQIERFGVNATIQDPREGDYCFFRIQCKSRQLALYMETYVKRAGETIRVPEFIRISEPLFRVAYMQGVMDANARPIQILTTIYEPFARDIQALATSFGLTTRLTSGENWHDKYSITIINLRDKQWWNDLSQNVPRFTTLSCVSSKPQNSNGVPSRIVPSVPTKWKHMHSGQRTVSLDMLDKLGLPVPYVPHRVTGLETLQYEAETYDIQVANDECFVAENVLVHNSALISLSNFSDDRMRQAKTGNWWTTKPWLAMANNSIAYTERPDPLLFGKEWLSLWKSESGERGIFNRVAARKQVSRSGRRDPNYEWGTNPCVTDDTWIMTGEGPQQVCNLIGRKDFTCLVHGSEYPVESNGFFHTGKKQVFKVETYCGRIVRATANHPFLRVLSRNLGDWENLENLSPGDWVGISEHVAFQWKGSGGTFDQGWLVGEVVGDGGIIIQKNGNKKNRAYARFWGDSRHEMLELAIDKIKEQCKLSRSDFKGNTGPIWSQALCTGLYELCRTVGRITDTKQLTNATHRTSSDFQRGFIRGLFDADGTVADARTKGASIRLGQANKSLLQQVQLMLSRFGIQSVIYFRKDSCWRKLPDGNGGTKSYLCQEYFELVVTKDSMLRYRDRIGFYEPAKQAKLENLLSSYTVGPYRSKFIAQIRSIVPIGERDVYDVTVSQVHQFCGNGFRLHNCSEIILRPNECCNLTEVVIRADDDTASLTDKVELATILGTLQSTLTNFYFVSPEWKKNCEEERLLGVSLTGIMDNRLTASVNAKLASTLSSLKNVAIAVNKQWAQHLGITQSTAITCVKPSGTVSQLVDSASGIHPRWSRFYTRTVRCDKKDPMYPFLRDQGIPCEDELFKPQDTAVFSFPFQSPPNAIVREGICSAVDQLELWNLYQDHWCEHKPSITVYVREDEWLEVGAWVWKHFDDISGVCFLPYDNGTYKQAPYQEITRQQYEEAVQKMPLKLDWSKLTDYEKEEPIRSTTEFACTADACEYVDL